MANLTDAATYEDLTSSEGIQAFEAFYESLSFRKARNFKALHVLVSPIVFYAVDFAIMDASLPTLVKACETRLLLIPEDEVMPLQPRDTWWAFWTAPLIKVEMVMMRSYRRQRQFAILRGTR